MALACSVGLVVSVRVCVCVCMHNLEEGCEENGAQSEKLGEASHCGEIWDAFAKKWRPQTCGRTPSGAVGGERKEVGTWVDLTWWSGKRL